MRALLITLTLTFGEPSMHPHAAVAPDAPELYLMPQTTSRFGMPQEYEQAKVTFADAQKQYDAGKADKAAPLFLKVAELLKAPKQETTYSDAFTKMRGIAYKNAALAFGLDGDKAGAKKALAAAQKADPANAALLEKLIAAL